MGCDTLPAITVENAGRLPEETIENLKSAFLDVASCEVHILISIIYTRPA